MKLKNKIFIILAFMLILFLSIDNKVHATYDVTVGDVTYNLPDIPEDIEYTNYLLTSFQHSDYTCFYFFYTNDSNVSYVLNKISNSGTTFCFRFYNSNNEILPFEYLVLRSDNLANGYTWTYIRSISDYTISFSSSDSVPSLYYTSSSVNVYEDSYSEENLVFQGANRDGSDVSDSGAGSGSTDSDNESSESSDTGWLGSIGNWFSNLFDKIGNLANDIGSAISNVIKGLFQGLFDLVTWLTDLLNPKSDNWIVKLIVDGFKELFVKLFVPEDDYFSNNINKYKTALNEKIPFYTYYDTLSSLKNVDTTDDNINISVNLENYNLLDKAIITVNNFINFSYFSKYKDTWYAWVRVFTYISLVIYNLNEIIKFLRGFNLTNGSGDKPVGTGFYMSDGSRNPNFKGFGRGD